MQATLRLTIGLILLGALSLTACHDTSSTVAPDEPGVAGPMNDKERMQAARRIALAGWMAQPLQLSLLRMGPVELVHLPGESMIEFQLFTQKQKPDRFIAVAAYGDLATGYICTEQAFTEGGYEPSASRVAPKTEAILKKAIGMLLKLE